MVRRILVTIPVLFGVSVVVFLALHLAPGNPAQILLGPTATPASLHRLEAQLGLNEPLPAQYYHWVVRLVHGDLGTSITLHQSVSSLVGSRFLNTLVLAVPAFILATVGGLAAGSVAAVQRGGWLDGLLSVGAFAGLAMPAFWLGLLLILYVGLDLHALPVSGMYAAGSFGGVGDLVRHLVLPAITLAVAPAAVIAQVTRSSFIDELSKPYVRTARAKGCSRRRAELRHALRNTWMPVATTLALEVTYVVAGDVLVEFVFNWPGIGALLVSSVLSLDYPTVLASALLLAFVVVLANLGIDLLYPLIDPRVSHRG